VSGLSPRQVSLTVILFECYRYAELRRVRQDIRAAIAVITANPRPFQAARAIRLAKGADERGAIQYVRELAPFLAMVLRGEPSVVVEIGTHVGGVFWAFCQASEDRATIMCIDLPGGPFGAFQGAAAIPRLRTYGKETQELKFLLGDSHSESIYDEVTGYLDGRAIDVLFIDGDHSYDGVKRDYETFEPLVARGGLVAFHDIVPGPEENVGGVPRFWSEVRQEGSNEFVQDWAQGRCGIGVVQKR
jgi:predicted O-methyltransferase YrrM